MTNFYASEWHRWDPHIHAPGTALEDRFANDWAGYFKRLNDASPEIVALGVTDYLSLRTYEAFRENRPKKVLQHLALVFPNVEFRLSPTTARGHAINAHLLVSPEEADHVERVYEALGRLTTKAQNERVPCTTKGLMQLGRMQVSSKIDDDHAYRLGVGQFKVDVSEFLEWLNKEPWLRANVLLGLAGGNDGLAGIRRDSGFRQYHDELVRAADVLFSGQSSDRLYYAGKSPGESAEQIIKRYGSLKPCLHGSDAHELAKLLKPDLDRYCWIKAIPSFDGLRQVLFEPWDRVSIGDQPPPLPDDEQLIASVAIEGHSGWFATPKVPLGSSLVAVIGEKGSGKTALADIIAAAAGAWDETDASFLAKAGDHLRGSTITLTWRSGRSSTVELPVPSGADREEEVRYLSQQFVERLCSADLLAEELVREVERVVFEHIPAKDRLNSIDFDDLVRKKTEGIQAERVEIRQELSDLNETINQANTRKAGLPKKRDGLAKLDVEVKKTDDALRKLLAAKTAGTADRIKKLRDKRNELTAAAARIQEQIGKTNALEGKILRTEERFTSWFEELRSELLLAGILRETWPLFKPTFTGKPLDPIRDHRTGLEKQHTAIVGAPTDPQTAETLVRLSAILEAEEMKLQLDEKRRRQVTKLQNQISELTAKRGQVSDEIAEIERWEAEERPRVRDRRDAVYSRYFELVLEEKSALESLYAPLRADLAERSTGERDLDFEVLTKVDVSEWAGVGEDMIDLRKSGRYMQRGALEEEARELLESAWIDGDAGAIRDGLKFVGEGITQGGGLRQNLRQGYTLKHVADWLYSVDHIRLEYGLKYKGTPLRYLSPGTRGIVLLILYLAVDTLDDRPLVVDQPEENLDNASIYEVLVQYFREAKTRRQIILVTHNPNLVVNTDAEQIIVATAQRRSSGLPAISYACGPIEHVGELKADSPQKERICEILEGGRRAFRNRDRRYG